MNCDEKNTLLSQGNIDRDDLWPKIKEYENARYQFRFEFGLSFADLPQKPGLITIRGARQTGKSTWMELALLQTIEDFGKGTAFLLNGDEIYSHSEFQEKLLGFEASFRKSAKIKRVFIDEITAIPDWQRVFKRLVDSGHLKDVLIVTTGSNAADIRHASERLPGRKGKLARGDYLFLPISYKEYLYQTRGEIGTFPRDSLFGYFLTGGSPVAVSEMAADDKLSDNFVTLVKDWLIGAIAESGRSRIFALSLIRKLFDHGASRVSFTKLAREAGLANNSAALDYIEKLVDLCAIMVCPQWDHQKKTYLQKKASKIQFINLAVASAFHPNSYRYLDELRRQEGQTKAAFYEWVVAQELWRRENLRNQLKNVAYGPI